ncbi:VOC family protein [Brevundimonas sp. NPDC092305]|uniref:VOC family protein n=1 Tax=Brevundimonas sp. NPDC092305 TaxID=3363957 RepID=UPI003818D72D
MLTVAGIDHVVLRVKDADAAIAFYNGVLGCPVEKHNEPLGLFHLRAGDSLIDLVTLDGKIGLAGGAGPAVEGRNLDHVCLRLKDYDPDTTMAHLRAHGVAFEEPASRFGAGGEAMSIYLRDPDGNGIELRG